jgi:DnaJ family protein C protein 19
MIIELVLLTVVVWWFWSHRRTSTHAMTREDARSLLEVSATATSDEIRAAHRRLVARVHPDVGGSADLTRQVNAARDTLLRQRLNP